MAGQQQQCEEKSSDFCYTDMSSSTSNPTIQFQTHDQVNHIHTFVSDPTEMFNLTTSMEMIGFSKNLHQQQQQQDFTPAETTSHENLIVHHDSATWQQENRTMIVDDSSLRCLFPSQGLSLSLSSTSTTNPFELRHNTGHQQHQQQQMLQDGFLMNTTTNIYNHQGQGESQFLLKNSKFLLPLQHLLNEFCSLETKQHNLQLKQKSLKFNKQSEEDSNGNCSSINHSLTSLELVELQKRKTKLLSMLEEVDRKYKNYCNQMKAVVSSFEAIAGNGAAIVYSTLALKGMSRHFRCLKDGILDQIQVTRKAMGEKDPVTPGATRGETPRLRIIDRTLRQQRVFQQINMMESHAQPWRPQRGLPECSVSVLRAWLFEHFLHPYPSDVDKHILARQTGLSKSQVSNWFINARVRLWKPMVEEMYMEEEKEQQRNATSSEGGANNEDDITICTTKVLQNPPSPTDKKLAETRLLRIDSDCMSSIINNSTDHKNDPKNLSPQQQCNSTRATDTFGSVDLDFSSYMNHSSDMVIDQSFHGGSGVSLTLGLQQHGGSAVNLAFQSPGMQSPMFFTREQIEECETVNQYSFLDGEGQNMQYRNLMGTQLLHDIA